MDRHLLTPLLDLPETHQKILGDYDGAYSLGIGDDGTFVLDVEGDDLQRFPQSVTIGFETIPVVVRGGFIAPEARSV